MVDLADVALARYRIAGYLSPTPLEAAPGLGEQVFLKLENTNRTHSFKIRGALNAVLSLDETARSKGLTAASTGNHAQALSYAARLVGAGATIHMPGHTPRRKVNGVRQFGGHPVLEAADYDEAETSARQMEREKGMTFVSAYNDPQVVAGAGTIGLEIVEALPEVEQVVVPVSGGGLIAGVATAVKGLRPSVKVVGVNIESAPAMYNLFYQTDKPHRKETLAEALSGDIETGCITIDICRRLVDEIVLVTEQDVAEAMRWSIDEQGLLVEGGGSVGIAALQSGVLKADRPTAIVVSGGNVDGRTVRRILSEP